MEYVAEIRKIKDSGNLQISSQTQAVSLDVTGLTKTELFWLHDAAAGEIERRALEAVGQLRKYNLENLPNEPVRKFGE